MTNNNQKNSGMFFVTTSRNILSIIGGGYIYPADLEYRYYKDSRERFNGAIPLWTSHLPGELKMENEEVDKQIIIELDKKLLLKYLKSTDKFFEDEAGLITRLPVPVKYIKRYIFSSQKALDDFVLRLFDDVPVEKELLVVDSDLPWEQANLNHDTRIVEGKGVDLENISILDKVLGSILSVYKLSQPERTVLQHIEKIYPLAINVLLEKLRL